MPGAINTYITFANNLRGFHYVTSRKPDVNAEQVQACSPVQSFSQLLDLKTRNVSHLNVLRYGTFANGSWKIYCFHLALSVCLHDAIIPEPPRVLMPLYTGACQSTLNTFHFWLKLDIRWEFCVLRIFFPLLLDFRSNWTAGNGSAWFVTLYVAFPPPTVANWNVFIFCL